MYMKLTELQVAEIKDQLSAGKTQPEIAAKYGVSRSLISDIATGRAWSWTSGEVPKKKAGGQPKAIPAYDPTNTKVLALEAEIIHLQDERNVMRRQVRAMTKTHGLFTALTEEMNRIVVPMSALPRVPPVERKIVNERQIEEHLVMHISDGHHDQIVKPAECGGLERYNFPISMRRGERYVDTVLKWTQQTLAPQFHFPVLTVLAYGDHTSGEIHNAAQRSYFRNMFKNSFAIGQLHALMYRDLAPYFETVNVVYVPGNHGRRSMKKDYHGAHDNWDFMVGETARLHCRDIPNINFVIPDTFTINLEINGVGFCVFHGDDIRSNLGIPWYGMERRQRRIMALSSMQESTRIRYYCCGHFHRPASMNELDGEMLMNGAWLASDAYAYNSFGGYTEPSQLIHGVNPKYGITWRMPVKLKGDDDASGPQRYKIDLMEEVG
jgi:hypothetical protein